MWYNQHKQHVIAGLTLTALSLMPGIAPLESSAAEPGARATERAAVEVSQAEFQKLRPLLDVTKQPWTTIPWKYSITEARKQAAEAHKPIFMVVNTGNALGCT
jgi:hypothetical protein